MLPARPTTAMHMPVQTTRLPSETSGDITLDPSGVAQDQVVETVAAVLHLPGPHPDLPDTQQVSAQQIDEVEDFRATLAKTVASLITPSI
jgi:hypothetical protein